MEGIIKNKMELIYQNEYGASYAVRDFFKTGHQFQIIIGSISIFLSKEDLIDLQNVINNFKGGCSCEDCGEKIFNSIWKYTYLADVRLKVDYISIGLLKDLITGTLFVINMNTTLKQNQIS